MTGHEYINVIQTGFDIKRAIDCETCSNQRFLKYPWAGRVSCSSPPLAQSSSSHSQVAKLGLNKIMEEITWEILT